MKDNAKEKLFPVALADSLVKELSWFLDKKSTVLELEGEHRPAEFASHLAVLNQHLRRHDSLGIDVVAVRALPGNFDKSAVGECDRLAMLLQDIASFFEARFAGLVELFVLHGSLADGGYKKGWSDVDTFMVLPNSTLENTRSLLGVRQGCLELRKIFERVAPMQHHGIQVVPESVVESYGRHYLPPEALAGALSLTGKEVQFELKLRHYDPAKIVGGLRARRWYALQAQETGLFKHHPKNGKYLEVPFNNPDDNMYQLYSLLNYIMTLPAVVLTGLGTPAHKRESFELVRPMFRDDTWELMRRATKIRERWEQEEYPLYAGNFIPQWVVEELGDDYMDRFVVLLDEAIALLETPNAS